VHKHNGATTYPTERKRERKKDRKKKKEGKKERKKIGLARLNVVI